MSDHAFADKIIVAIAIAAWVVVLPVIAVALVVRALLAPLIDFERTRRWHKRSGLVDLFPGKPRWADRERRVAALVSALQALPVERFDGFEPQGVPGRLEIWDASDRVPRAIRKAVEDARYRTSSVVSDRAQRERPDAGYTDYMIHWGGAWELSDPHWMAAERAAEAGATAILLDGYMSGQRAAEWIEGAARLVE